MLNRSALAAEIAQAIHRRFQEFSRIEFAFALHRDLAERWVVGREPAIGVDIDFADTMPDAPDDFLDRHAPGLWHLAAECIERSAAVAALMTSRASPDAYWEPAMDFLHHPHRKNVAVWLAREFIRTMRRTHRNRQRINLENGTKSTVDPDRSAIDRLTSPSMP